MTTQTLGLSLTSPLALLYRHRALLWEMTRRDVSERYVGHVLGMAWAIGHPLILVLVYVLIFRFVFQARLPEGTNIPGDYVTYLLAGLIPWITAQEALARGALAISSNASLVKQVVFPLEILPVKAVLGAMTTQVIGTVLLLLYVVGTTGTLPWTWCLLPLLWGIQLLGLIGLAFVLSAVGAYFRDIKDVVQVFCTVGLYLMPVVYLPDWLPVALRPFIYANPFSYMTWCYQDALCYGHLEHLWAWPIYLGLALAAFWVGYLQFRWLKAYFGSIL